MEIDLFNETFVNRSVNKYSIENINTRTWQKLGIFNYTFIWIYIYSIKSCSSNFKHYDETMLQNNVSSSIEGNNFYILLTVGLPRKSFPISFTYALKPFRTWKLKHQNKKQISLQLCTR